MNKIAIAGAAAAGLYIYKNISIFGYEENRSVVFGWKDQYFISAHVMPFHEYSDHLHAFCTFIDDAYLTYMRSVLGGDIEIDLENPFDEPPED